MTMPEYIEAASIRTVIATPRREAAWTGTEDGADGERDEDEHAAGVTHEVEAPEHFAEDRARQHARLGHLAERDDFEDGRRGDAAKRRQSADPGGNRQDRGEPKHKHSHHYN